MPSVVLMVTGGQGVAGSNPAVPTVEMIFEYTYPRAGLKGSQRGSNLPQPDPLTALKGYRSPGPQAQPVRACVKEATTKPQIRTPTALCAACQRGWVRALRGPGFP